MTYGDVKACYTKLSGRALLLLDAAPDEWEPLPDEHQGLAELVSCGLVETDSHMAGPFPSQGYRRVWRRARGMPIGSSATEMPEASCTELLMRSRDLLLIARRCGQKLRAEQTRGAVRHWAELDELVARLDEITDHMQAVRQFCDREAGRA